MNDIASAELPASQFTGEVEGPNGPLRVLLSIDADRPSEFFAQWTSSSDNSRGGGCLFQATPNSPIGWTLRPRTIFRANPGLHANFSLSPEEISWRDGTTVDLQLDGVKLVGNWNQTKGPHGIINLHARVPKSAVQAEQCDTWDDFKRWAERLRAEGNGEWFRGHGNSSYPLMTSLHRLNRFRLDRYLSQELPRFSSQAEAILNRPLDLNNPKDYATVMGLARHHGMPTPVLDWTASPYIAAFFAFADALENAESGSTPSKVRIFALSRSFIDRVSPSIVTMSDPKIFIAAIRIGPIHNPRLSAQQGTFLLTNMGDVEVSINELAKIFKETHLSAADMPANLATSVLRDLAFMGLTASTMFPGLDGIGRTIKHEMLYS